MIKSTPNPDFWLKADWPAPANIKAGTTLRSGGMSQAPYDSFNMGDHVGDDPTAVKTNRQQLFNFLQLPSEPVWLKQVHSKIIVNAALTQPGMTEADGSYTVQKDIVCAVLTADCLPVLMCNKQGTQVAAVHAGWRGLADGIIEQALEKFTGNRNDLMAWLGPAIGADNYEVGDEVRQAFIDYDANASSAFKHISIHSHAEHGNEAIINTGSNKWLMDIYTLAHQRLNTQGITAIYGGKFCTYNETDRFYSYRKNNITGRMASLIWIE